MAMANHPAPKAKRIEVGSTYTTKETQCNNDAHRALSPTEKGLVLQTNTNKDQDPTSSKDGDVTMTVTKSSMSTEWINESPQGSKTHSQPRRASSDKEMKKTVHGSIANKDDNDNIQAYTHGDNTPTDSKKNKKDHYHTHVEERANSVCITDTIKSQREGITRKEHPDKDHHREQGECHHSSTIQTRNSASQSTKNVYRITEWFTQVLGISDEKTATQFAHRAINDFLLQSIDEVEKQFFPPEWNNTKEEPWTVVTSQAPC